MIGSVDLSPAHRAIVERILAEHVPECEVWAFGSRAAWTSNDSSDLDLAVVGEVPLPQRTLARLSEAFEESPLPMRVDVLDWYAISSSFRGVIKRDYVVVQEVAKKRKRTAGEWRSYTLGELTDNFDAIRIPVKQSDRRSGPYPYYGASGVVDYVDGFLFDGEHLLIAEDGENLRTRTTPIVFLTKGKFWVNNHAHIVRGNANADTRFLKYALSDLEISGYLTGSTMPKLTQGNMNRIPLLTPPLPEQRAIAHILGTLDDKIELNRRMNQTLEEMARALFKSWFVDFDPVRAKAAPKQQALPHRNGNDWEPGVNGAMPADEWTVERARAYLDAMDPQIASLFPDRLVGSELGQIPDGWDVAGFSDVVTQLRENENPFASPETVYSHYSLPAYDDGQTPKRELGEGIKSVKTRVPPGTVLLSKLNPEIERVWLPNITDNDRAVCSTEFLVLRPEPPFDRSYAYCLMRATAFRERLQSLVTGTSKSHQRAPARAILSLDVLYPPAPILETFETAASAYLNQAVFIARDSTTLAGLRDAQLPKLLSGEMRAGDSLSGEQHDRIIRFH